MIRWTVLVWFFVYVGLQQLELAVKFAVVFGVGTNIQHVSTDWVKVVTLTACDTLSALTFGLSKLSPVVTTLIV